jgi:hypothetical protein
MNFNQLNERHLLEVGGVFLLFQECRYVSPLVFDVCSQRPSGCEVQIKNNKDKVPFLLSRNESNLGYRINLKQGMCSEHAPFTLNLLLICLLLLRPK